MGCSTAGCFSSGRSGSVSRRTPARRISYQDSLAFERIHETEYLRLGFELVDIPPGPVQQRTSLIDACLRSWA